MTGVTGAAAPSVGAPLPGGPLPTEERSQKLARIVDSLDQLSDDTSVPRNVRRGAASAKGELGKPRVALDVRIASAVYVLDDLANDPNLPTHGRTAIWSIISSLESFQ
ncbi:MAG: UPF0147 family protein [Thermoplasmata archaeon]|nr:UPF0147 family protein [Thermoplasmata archaeon]